MRVLVRSNDESNTTEKMAKAEAVADAPMGRRRRLVLFFSLLRRLIFLSTGFLSYGKN
ncbi:hypothetical protein Hdeb2414_s0013g00409171 [Helianthus debilis subsp. tardiflorus]